MGRDNVCPHLTEGQPAVKKQFTYLPQYTLVMCITLYVERTMCVFCNFPGRELPPICCDVMQKQRFSIDTIPHEVKAPFPSDPVIPLPITNLSKHFIAGGKTERAPISGDWRDVWDFYLTTFDSFLEINAAFKVMDFQMVHVEDSGVNSKCVNAVYDALLCTPQDIQKSVLKGIINSLLREWKG
uniref:Uncharacterized protein n=1 Tax=Salmo trutta TaxID=8032 RepID=A0A674EYC2_SALTR